MYNNKSSRKPSCEFYSSGACWHGIDCRYYHEGDRDDPKRKRIKPEPKAIGENEYCRHFRRGHCDLGSKCRFKHENPSDSKANSARSKRKLSDSQKNSAYKRERLIKWSDLPVWNSSAVQFSLLSTARILPNQAPNPNCICVLCNQSITAINTIVVEPACNNSMHYDCAALHYSKNRHCPAPRCKCPPFDSIKSSEPIPGPRSSIERQVGNSFDQAFVMAFHEAKSFFLNPQANTQFGLATFDNGTEIQIRCEFNQGINLVYDNGKLSRPEFFHIFEQISKVTCTLRIYLGMPETNEKLDHAAKRLDSNVGQFSRVHLYLKSGDTVHKISKRATIQMHCQYLHSNTPPDSRTLYV